MPMGARKLAYSELSKHHRSWQEFAESQHGLVARRQLLENGWDRGRIQKWLDHGRLISVRAGVYRAAGAPLTPDAVELAPILSTSKLVVVSHLSAARRHGLNIVDVDFETHLLSQTFRVADASIRSHQTDTLPAEDRVTVRCVPTTSVARTILDLTEQFTFGMLGVTLDDALRRQMCTLAQVRRCWKHLGPRHGSKRLKPLRLLLEYRDRSFERAGSEQEHRVLQALRSDGLPEPVQQYRITIAGESLRPDFAYPARLLAIEYDGYEIHNTPSQFERDRHKDALLQLAGWTVLRFGRIAVQSGEMVRLVRLALA